MCVYRARGGNLGAGINVSEMHMDAGVETFLQTDRCRASPAFMDR